MERHRITLVSGNRGKVNELRQIFANVAPFVDLRVEPMDLVEIQGTPEEVARAKCVEACRRVQGPVLIEDTSLVFNAINPLPGVYVKWFIEAMGLVGLANLAAIHEDKTAQAISTLAFSRNDGCGPISVSNGVCSGIVVPPRIKEDVEWHGWDPVFQPDGSPHTFAEAPKHENAPRLRAVRNLLSDIFAWEMMEAAEKEG